MLLNLQQEEELSEEVRKYPAIYDKSRKEHRERFFSFFFLFHVIFLFVFDVMKEAITTRCS